MPLVTTGRTLTNDCQSGGVRACPQCRLRPRAPNQSKCLECQQKYHEIQKTRFNLAGGRARYEALSADKKASLAETARRLYHAGREFQLVARFQEEAVKDGFVYVLVNPAWPEMVKIGSAVDVASRLDQFQTGSPFRDYEMVYSVYTHDRLKAERTCHARIATSRLQGEWFSCSVEFAKAILNTVRDEFDEADVQQAFAKVEAP